MMRYTGRAERQAEFIESYKLVYEQRTQQWKLKCKTREGANPN